MARMFGKAAAVACAAAAPLLFAADVKDAVREDPAAILKAGRAALEDRLYDVAENQFKEYLKAVPAAGKSTEEVVVLLMRALHEQKKNEEILSLYKSKRGWLDKPQKADAFQFWHAFALYDLGRFDEALKDLDGFEKGYPSSEYAGQAKRLEGWCHLKMGKPEEAILLFQEFDRLCGQTAEGPANLLELGKTLVSVKKGAQAAEVFAKLVKLSPELVAVQDGHYWYGQVLLEAGKWDEANAVLMGIAANTKAREDLRAEALMSAAVALNAVSKKDEALDALRRGIEMAKSPEIKRKGEFDFAQYLLDIGRLEQGIPLIKQYISASPTNPLAGAAQLKLAQALLENSKFKESVDEFQHYLETFTNVAGQAEAHAGKGWALSGEGRHAEAAGAFMKGYGLFAEGPKKEQCLFKVGDAYFANNQFKLALETYERFVKEYPSSKIVPNAYYQIAESMARGGQPAEAEAMYREVSVKYPSSPFAEESLLRIAELRAGQGKWIDAVEGFGRVMSVYTNGLWYSEALHGRGVANYQLMKFAAALEDFDSVTNRFPGSSVYEHSYYMGGMCSYWLGEDARALSVCRDFVKRYPASQWVPDAMFWIAKYEYNEGSFENAEKDFLSFTEKYATSRMADNALLWAGLSASKRKEYARCIELMSRLAKEYPSSKKMTEARFAQADALSELARFPEAILIFDEIISKYPESPLISMAWARKGDCQFGLGADDKKRYEEAIESYKVVAGDTRADLELVMRAEYRIGACLEKLGKAAEAFQQYYRKVILKYFEDADKGIRHNEACKVWFTRAVLNAAELMEAKKDWPGAVKVLERLVKAGVPAAEEAGKRIKRLKAEHWWLFYNER
jgi:TolA-binding protein